MRETLHRVVPESDSTICTSRGDDVSWSDGLDIVDWALVSDKSVGSHGGFEVPNHNGTILRTGDDLL